MENGDFYDMQNSVLWLIVALQTQVLGDWVTNIRPVLQKLERVN